MIIVGGGPGPLLPPAVTKLSDLTNAALEYLQTQTAQHHIHDILTDFTYCQRPASHEGIPEN